MCKIQAEYVHKNEKSSIDWPIVMEAQLVRALVRIPLGSVTQYKRDVSHSVFLVATPV